MNIKSHDQLIIEIFPASVSKKAENLNVVFPIISNIAAFPDKLWFEISSDELNVTHFPIESALIGLLYSAMYTGADIKIHGLIDEDLIGKIKFEIQALLIAQQPFLHRISVESENTTSEKEQLEKSVIATGFSAGVDSFAVLHRHFFSETSQNLKINHLFFNNVGSHGRGSKGEKLYRLRSENISLVASHFNLPVTMVNSNLGDFYPEGMYFIKSHTLRNAAAILLFSQIIKTYYYASAYPYTEISTSKGEIAAIDPLLLPLLSSQIRFLSGIPDLSRTAKTLLASEISESYSSLNVCVYDNGDGNNCSTCWKCMRTQFTLELQNKLDLYSEVFDHNLYKRELPKWLNSLDYENDMFAQEIHELAIELNNENMLIFSQQKPKSIVSKFRKFFS